MRLPFLLAAVSASQHRHPSPQHTVAAGALRTAQSEKAECDSDTREGERLREAINGTQRSLCAIGDTHGDPNHALRALRLCDAVDAAGRWSGGTMTVVQVGDVFDRGNASIALQHVLWELRDQAAEAGGELKLLLGNHELMNLQGRIHYVHGFSRAGDHRGELAEFGGAKAWQHALHPVHGELGRRIVVHDALAVRGEGACRTLFLHAGLRASTATQYEGSVERINLAIREQIERGAGEMLDPQDGPLWFRGYARPRAGEEAACNELQATLDALGGGVARMAVGHNIVPWVSSRCAGRLQLLDVGMSGAYGGRPAAWRCELGPDGAVLRALYEDEDEAEPPPLCARCAELKPKVASPQDWHDCLEYCGRQF